MENSVFEFYFLKKVLLRNYVADFVEICNNCARKAIIEAAKRIINFDKVCHSYSDLNFGVTFFGTQCTFHALFTSDVNCRNFKFGMHIDPQRH